MHYILFAEDTTIFKSGYDVHELAAEISANLNILLRWCDLTLSKFTKKLHNHGHLNREQVKVFINGQEVNMVNSTKFLGVIIDSRLKWYDHINSVSEKNV